MLQSRSPRSPGQLRRLIYVAGAADVVNALIGVLLLATDKVSAELLMLLLSLVCSVVLFLAHAHAAKHSRL